MKMEEIKKSHVATPMPIPEGYDWTKELWVKDGGVRNLSYYIAHHVCIACRMQGDTTQSEEDEIVFSLLRLDLMEKVWKSPVINEIIRNRVLAACAQGIDEMITQWIKRFGSIDSKGPPQRPTSDAN